MGLTVEKCLQAWTNSLRQMNTKADIVFFGDSLTYYGDFSSVFPDKVVCNLGLRGDTIQGLIDRVDQVKILEPKLVYVMAGINDVACKNNDDFEFLYNGLISRIMTESPTSSIVIQSILPVNEKDFEISCCNEQIINCNNIIRYIAGRYNLHYIDLFRQYLNNGYLSKIKTIDGIHLIPPAYKDWYSLLKNTNIY